jgi:hypothetical protein
LTKVKDWIAQTSSTSGDSVGAVAVDLAEHISDTDNPHEVKKTDVRLITNVAEMAVTRHETALSIAWGQITGAPSITTSDYAAIRFGDNVAAIDLVRADLYHQVLTFDTDGPAVVSQSDAVNQRLILGSTRTYEAAFMVAGEVAGAGCLYEFEVWAIYPETVSITDITQASPAVVTAAGHGRSNGDIVKISGVLGMTEANGKLFTVANATPDTFELTDTEGVDVNSAGWGAYTSGGDVQRAVGVGAEVYQDFPNGQTGSGSGSFIFEGQAGWALELYAENQDNTNDITIRECTMTVLGL